MKRRRMGTNKDYIPIFNLVLLYKFNYEWK